MLIHISLSKAAPEDVIATEPLRSGSQLLCPDAFAASSQASPPKPTAHSHAHNAARKPNND
jgi:hypothetical protein